MKKIRIRTDIPYLSVWLMLFVISAVPTVSGESTYVLDWYTIDGGGGQSSGGPYVLTGTIGQPDAGYLDGDNYELLGGFWVGGPLCIVNFIDFANFAEYWLQSGSGLPADLYEDGTINYDDLLEFANVWLCICPYNWPLK